MKEEPTGKDDSPDSSLKDVDTQEILEEILDLSRSNQKLIRNPEGSFTSQLEDTRKMVMELLERQERKVGFSSRGMKRLHPRMIDEFIHMGAFEKDDPVGIQMTLAMIRDELPWIYDSGMEAIRIIRSSENPSDSESAIRSFHRIVEFTFEHPLMRERMERSKEWHILSRELPHLLERAFMRLRKG